jgi:hypothetical protein
VIGIKKEAPVSPVWGLVKGIDLSSGRLNGKGGIIKMRKLDICSQRKKKWKTD